MIRTLAAALATSTCIVALATSAAAQTREYNIPAGSLKSALDAYVRQSGRQIIYRADQVRFARSPGARGQQSAEAALAAVLDGSGFTTRVDGKLVAIVREGNGSSGSGSVASTAVYAAAATNDSAEIIVTAQKRQERLQEVPVPVSVVAAQSLVNAGQQRLQDYYAKIPGLGLTVAGDGGTPQVTIRGITTGGYNNPTVSVVIDDIPFGPSTAGQAGWEVPDIDPSDLQRVEVLRGPQGTLYGASSMGGLIKYVTADPSTREPSGRLQAGMSTVSHGEKIGRNLRGSVNVPLDETFAIRVSGYSRFDPGYVDNVQTGKNDVNSTRAEGGRISALWQPVDGWSVKLGALFQHTRANGVNEVQDSLGGLRQSYLPDTGGFNKKAQAYSAIITGQLGEIELVSLTGYGINKISTRLDATPVLGALMRGAFGGPGSTVSEVQYRTSKVSQEFRMNASFADRFDIVLGGFFTNEKTPVHQIIDVLGATRTVANPRTGEQVAYYLETNTKREYREHAVFGDLTFRITDQLDLQVGGRQSWNRILQRETVGTNPYAASLGRAFFTTGAPQRATDDPFTYLATIRYRPSTDLMAYVRIASGYRPGGANGDPAQLTALGLPLTFGSDRTQNYEIGVKGNLFNRALSFDLSAYHIDWSDLQLRVREPVTLSQYTSNGGKAKSQGIELSLEAHPLSGMTLSGWAAYNHAVITKVPTTSVLVISPGDRLPYSSPWSASASIDQEFPLNGDVTAFVGGTLTYVGDRKGIFRASPIRSTFPDYTQIDVRAGVRMGAWEVNGFVTNLTDSRGVLRSGFDASFATFPVTTYTLPRTIGLSVARTF